MNASAPPPPGSERSSLPVAAICSRIVARPVLTSDAAWEAPVVPTFATVRWITTTSFCSWPFSCCSSCFACVPAEPVGAGSAFSVVFSLAVAALAFASAWSTVALVGFAATDLPAAVTEERQVTNALHTLFAQVDETAVLFVVVAELWLLEPQAAVERARATAATASGSSLEVPVMGQADPFGGTGTSPEPDEPRSPPATRGGRYLCHRGIMRGMTAAAEELLGALSAIRRALRRYSGRPVELSSLTGAQLELVRLLRRRPGASIADAALELRVAPNTVSTLVRQLSEAGVVARAVDGADRRVARLTLAPAISRKVDAWRDRRFEALGAALASLPREDRDSLAGALPALGLLAEALEAAGAGG